MSEMNELTRSLVRVEELITQGASQGAQHVLWTAQEYARQAVKLIKDQAALLTKQQLEYISIFGELQTALEEKAVLVKDVEIQKERAESAEAEIKELDEQEPVGKFNGEFRFLDGNSTFTADCYDALPQAGAELYARPAPAKRVPDDCVLLKSDAIKRIRDDCVPMRLLSTFDLLIKGE